MAYNYLLELYETIGARRREASQGVERGIEVDRERSRGRVDVLEEFEGFLKANYHPQLPRRIRTRLEAQGASDLDERVPAIRAGTWDQQPG